jgi:cation:H+ antiporter
MNNYVVLILGIISAGIGGELFVRGLVGIACWMRISAGIIGATVAAFATSSPELSVAINSSLEGKPQISLGDALGSNVINVALILAIPLLMSGLQSPYHTIKRDFPVALIAPVITGILAVDGALSRVDGILLLGMFSLWIIAVTAEARKQRSAAGNVLGEHKIGRALIVSGTGLAFLIAAGRLIVAGAKGIAVAFGVDEFIIGSTIVAIGTSVPELATTVISKIRGHDEVGLGTILGSNIFNGSFIISVAAIIAPITVVWNEVSTALIFGFAAVAITFPSREGWISRKRGVMLSVLYIAYICLLLW